MLIFNIHPNLHWYLSLSNVLHNVARLLCMRDTEMTPALSSVAVSFPENS